MSDEDLNDQALHWLETVANVGTLKEVPLVRFERERLLLGPLAERAGCAVGAFGTGGGGAIDAAGGGGAPESGGVWAARGGAEMTGIRHERMGQVDLDAGGSWTK